MPRTLVYDANQILAATEEGGRIVPEDNASGQLVAGWLRDGVPGLKGMELPDRIEERTVAIPPSDPFFGLALTEHMEDLGWSVHPEVVGTKADGDCDGCGQEPQGVGELDWAGMGLETPPAVLARKYDFSGLELNSSLRLKYNPNHDNRGRFASAPGGPRMSAPAAGRASGRATPDLGGGGGKSTGSKAAATINPNLPKVSVADVSGWNQMNSSAAAQIKKLAEMEKLHAAGDLSGLLGMKKVTPEPGKGANTYQKVVFATHAKLVADLQNKLGDNAAVAKPQPTHYTISAEQIMAHSEQAKPAASKPAEPETTPAGILKLDNWTQTGGKLGTQEGGTFVSPTGVKFYAKFPDDPNAARNEVLAGKLAELAGIKVAKYALVEKNGKLGVATLWEDGLQKADTNNPAHKAELQKQFIAHAWLGNWDAAGAGSEKPMQNIKINSHGQAVAVDMGGALEYKGSGGKKPAGAFSKNPHEISTMLDSSLNPSAEKFFGGLTNQQRLEAVGAMAKTLTKQSIQALVDKYHGGTQEQKDALTETLVARAGAIQVKALKEWGGEDQLHLFGLAPTPKTKPAPTPTTAVTPDGKTVNVTPAKPTIPPPPSGIFSGVGKFIYEHAQAGSLQALEDMPNWSAGLNSQSAKGKATKAYYSNVLAAVKAGGAVNPQHKVPEPPKPAKPSKVDMTGVDELTPPEFVSSQKANVEANNKKCAELAEVAKQGTPEALEKLKGMVDDSYPSPKLKEWHKALVNVLDQKLNPPPPPAPASQYVHEVAEQVKVVHKPTAQKIGSYYVLADMGGKPLGNVKATTIHPAWWAKGQEAFDKLPDNERDNVRYYTNSGYVSINVELRENTKHAAAGENALSAARGVTKASMTLKEGTVITRNHGLTHGDLEKLKQSVGKVIQDPGIMSCSVMDPNTWYGNVALRMTLGPGVKGLPANSFSAHKSEKEVILPPNTRMVVTSVGSSPVLHGGSHRTIVEVYVLPFQEGQCCPP